MELEESNLDVRTKKLIVAANNHTKILLYLFVPKCKLGLMGGLDKNFTW